MGGWVPENSENSGGGWVGCAEFDHGGVGGSPIFDDYKSVLICSVYSILDSQIDRIPDPGSSEKSANHQVFRVSTLLIHPLDRAESMQELVLIRGELSARAGRSELNSPDSTDCKSVLICSVYSILDSQIDRIPDPGSSEKSANHQGFRVSRTVQYVRQ